MEGIVILDETSQKKSSVKDADIVSSNVTHSSSFLTKFNDYFVSMQRIKIKDKVVFFRLLSTMINAGISLVKSIAILEKQEKNPILKKILIRFKEELKEGRNFSECLELFPASFDNAEIGMIRAGEKTGKLNDTLLDISEQVEKLSSIT